MGNPVCTCTITTCENYAFPGCHHEAACDLYRVRAARYEVDLRPGALTPIDGDVCGPHAPPVARPASDNCPDCEAEPLQRHARNCPSQVVYGPSSAYGRGPAVDSLPAADADNEEKRRELIAAARADAPGRGINPKDLVGATKSPLGLLPWTALVQVAGVFKVGADKYGAYNWRTPGQPVQHVTYVEAAFRHLAAYMDGQTIDPETNCNHLAHAVTGLLILLDASAIGNAIDNRPAPGVASELLALQAK